MTPREELIALRRMAELEAKAAGKPLAPAQPKKEAPAVSAPGPVRSGIHVPGFKDNNTSVFSQIGDKILPSKETKQAMSGVTIPGIGNVGAILDFADSAQHRALSLPYGIAQGLGHAIQYGAEAITGEDSDLSTTLRNDNQIDDAAMKQRLTDYYARDRDTLAANAGAVTGEIAPWAFGAPAKLTAALISKIAPKGSGILRRSAAGGTLGAAMGAAAPVDGEGSYGDQKKTQLLMGLAAGTGVPLGAAGLRGIKNTASDVFNMVARPEIVAGRNLSRILDADQSTVEKLRNVKQYFPGEKVSMAQALQTPEAAIAEKALRNRAELKAGFMNADNSNNAGRMEVVGKLAGDDATMSAAKSKRSAEYSAFSDDTLKAGPENQRYLKASQILDSGKTGRMSSADFDSLNKARIISDKVHKGSMSEADADKAYKALTFESKRAQTVFGQSQTAVNKNMLDPKATVKKLEGLTKNTNSTVRSAAKEQLENLRNNMDSRGMIPAHVLDGVRQNANETLAKAAAKNGTVSTQEAALYGDVAPTIIREIERKIPGYRANLRAYRDNSVPINTMDANQRILGPLSLRRSNSVGDQSLTLNDLAQGFKRDDKARYAMSPSARQDLGGVLKSLQRRSISDSVPSSASDTAYNLSANSFIGRKLFGDTLQGGNVGKSAGGVLGAMAGSNFGIIGAGVGAGTGTALGTVLDSQAYKLNQRVLDEVGKAATDSKYAADLIEKFLKAHPKEAPALLNQNPHWIKLLTAPKREARAQ